MKYTSIIILLSVFINCNIFSQKKLEILYLTGHTDRHHSWEVLSEFHIALLEEAKIFNVDKIILPEKTTNEKINFKKYDAVILNVNDVEWHKELKKDFEKYIRKGGGLIVVHEADNAFPEWKEYNRMTALGGWGNRNHKDGPYCYWKDGKLTKDYTPGEAGKHGKRVPFVINVRQSEHPVMKGLPAKWLHVKDELYGDLRGPAENIEVLATAFSETESGGTGKEEPVFFTVKYGKGRIFRNVLAHTKKGNDEALRNLGYQIVFTRGVEWAASGRVTQNNITQTLSAEQQTLRMLHEIK